MLNELARVARSCVRCPLAAGRTQVVFGHGDPTAQLMLVGEGPGRDEDVQGRPFVGRSGQLLDWLLTVVGLDREHLYVTNSVLCRPPGNRTPTPAEVGACSAWLREQLRLVKPRVVVALGNTAAQAVLGTSGVARLRTRQLALADGTRVFVTYHPSAALRDAQLAKLLREDLLRARTQL